MDQDGHRQQRRKGGKEGRLLCAVWSCWTDGINSSQLATSTGHSHGSITFSSVVFLLQLTLWFSQTIDASTRQNYERTTAPRIHALCTQTARSGFLRRDRASPVYLIPSMHLTEKHVFDLLLLNVVCFRSKWNQYGVWCGR